MHQSLESICISLDNLGNSIVNAYSDDRPLVDLFGWNCPPLSRHDLANMAFYISEKVKRIPIDKFDDNTLLILKEIPLRIDRYLAVTLPQLFSANCPFASNAYFNLIKWISNTLDFLFGWETINDSKVIPTHLARKIRSVEAELNSVVPDMEGLEAKVKMISDAYQTAESLPADLETLKEARGKIDRISIESAEMYGKIDSYHKTVEKDSENLAEKKKEIEKLVAQCEDAYRITTTKGLAASFEVSANRLRRTMALWVCGLLVALIVGGAIGATRFQEVIKSLQSESPHWGLIWMNFAISVIGLAAPIWFAWLATKQINQNFRLAEDYAFKASVAKAYEGYKKEAARIDEVFEARLFNSALSRFDEAPLRFVEGENHGSPWHELFGSSTFQKAMEAFPELKEKFVQIAKDGIDKLPKLNGKSKVENGIDES